MVRGLVVNKFRGDRSLFVDGERILAERAGLPVVGVIPFVDRLSLPEEDAAELVVSAARGDGPDRARRGRESSSRGSPTSTISTHSGAEPGVELRYVDSTDCAGRSRRRDSARHQEHGRRPCVATGDGIGGAHRPIGPSAAQASSGFAAASRCLATRSGSR